MHIYFDLDNTLIDELGQTVRPGMFELLESFKANNLQLSVWTASTKARAEPIISNLGLARYFSSFVYRDDYNPDATYAQTKSKDIRFGDGDLLVDDSKRNCEFVESIGLRSFKVKPYVTYIDTDPNELEELHRQVLPDVRFSIKKQSWVTKKLNLLFRKKPVPSWIK